MDNRWKVLYRCFTIERGGDAGRQGGRTAGRVRSSREAGSEANPAAEGRPVTRREIQYRSAATYTAKKSL